MGRKKRSSSSEDKVDRISNLPDSLIHDILSFMDMRFAVQTSVLSKRWKNIWRSLPFLSTNWTTFLRDGDSKESPFGVGTLSRVHNDYLRFVRRIFEFHDDSDLQIVSLGFIVCHDYLLKALNTFIGEAVDRHVQQLDINTHYYHDNSGYQIPHKLLTCESLQSLSITLGDLPYTGYVGGILPQRMGLPKLRKISLIGISISNSELQRLFSNCPLLEMVRIQDCNVEKKNQRIFDSQNIQSFVLIDGFHRRLGSALNSLKRTTKISLPSLKDIMCTGFMREDFSLENLSSLVRADLKMRLREKEADETAESYSVLLDEEKEVLSKRMLKYLGAVSNAQHLTLSSGFLEVLLQAPGALHYQASQLCNVETMKLEMWFTRGCLRSIAFLLKISPIVTTLILVLKESNLADVGDDWEAEFSSVCMFPHLKSVQIRESEGSDNELKFLSFLLKNCVALDKLVLSFRSTAGSLDEGRRRIRGFRRSLKRAHQASKCTYLTFEDGIARLLE